MKRFHEKLKKKYKDIQRWQSSKRKKNDSELKEIKKDFILLKYLQSIKKNLSDFFLYCSMKRGQNSIH